MSSDDELPLPRPSPQSTPRARRPNASRKRSHDTASDISTSSDAPFFSSDDLAEVSVDQYASPARKKQYRRAWYEPEDSRRAHSYPQMRAATKKPKDSGVYMNSDSSNSSADDGFAVDAIKVKATQGASARMAAFMQSSQPKKDDRANLVESTVARCLERGDESLDLSNSNLDTLPGEALRPLRQLIRKPVFGQTAFTEQACHPLTPELKLFLSANRLVSLPSDLFTLDTLTVLSLRANGLQSIPAAMGRLRNLKELNVASNRLRYLPWEMLSLVEHDQSLARLWLEPNPFLRPFAGVGDVDLSLTALLRPGADAIEGLLEKVKAGLGLTTRYGVLPPDDDTTMISETIAYLLLVKLQQNRQDSGTQGTAGDETDLHKPPIYVGSTAATFFNADGCEHRASPPAASSHAYERQVLRPAANPLASQPKANSTHVRTLFELALQSCSESPSAPELDQLLPADSPSLVVGGIKMAQKAHAEGGLCCSACLRPYVIPRAEWIEYWHLRHHDNGQNGTSEAIAYPFLRRVCSWGCAESALSVNRKIL